MAAITFKTINKTVNFASDIETEGVGYETSYNSRATLSEDGKVWTTYWSSFTYTSLGRGRFCYRGATHGFLQQDLIPEFGVFIIEKVEGSYGTFYGPKALEKYNAEKCFWMQKCEPMYRLVHKKLHREIDMATLGLFAAHYSKEGALPRDPSQVDSKLLKKIYERSEPIVRS